jgi:ABC-type amino acid transport system permease subunit
MIRMDRNYLKGCGAIVPTPCSALRAIIFSLLLRWLEELLRALFLLVVSRAAGTPLLLLLLRTAKIAPRRGQTWSQKDFLAGD